jgi:hypothetical protein
MHWVQGGSSRQRKIIGREFFFFADAVMNEYEKVFRFLEVGCGCGCSTKLPKEQFARLREDFRALTKPEQDIFLMGQLRSMDGGMINTSRRLKGEARIKKRTIYC